MNRLFTLLILLAATAMSVAASTPYSRLESKAQMFYDREEWASASAMYQLMLDERPTVADTYGRAIVAAGMRGARREQMALMKQAIDNRLPFDSVFASVERYSFALVQGTMYEQFLVEVKHDYPWLTRQIDGRLLNYYTFRRDGAKMIEYSTALLKGLPDNTTFLHSLAEGYLATGQYGKAVETLESILTIDPDNYQALVTLGNYYLTKPDPDPDKARDYLKRAYTVKPTPYVAGLLGSL